MYSCPHINEPFPFVTTTPDSFTTFTYQHSLVVQSLKGTEAEFLSPVVYCTSFPWIPGWVTYVREEMKGYRRRKVTLLLHGKGNSNSEKVTISWNYRHRVANALSNIIYLPKCLLSPCKLHSSVRATQSLLLTLKVSRSPLGVFALCAKRSKQLLSVGLLLLSSLTLKLGSVALSAFRHWFSCDTNHREWLQTRQIGFYSSYAGPVLTHIAHSFTCTLFCWGWHRGTLI